MYIHFCITFQAVPGAPSGSPPNGPPPNGPPPSGSK